ncbi:MAG: AMP-binding protein [Muribaculaceae bacterium]|nr:AMP-binding protein [Muribaculaceae bacterium]
MEPQTTLNRYIAQAVRLNWDRNAFSNFQGETYKFSDVARIIAELHLVFEHAGIKPGDKVALCAKNSAQWAVSALGCITYGAIAVPILNDFPTDTVHHLVNHSEAKLLFTDDATWRRLRSDAMPGLEGVVQLPDFTVVEARNANLDKARNSISEILEQRYPGGLKPDMIKYAEVGPDQLMLINYTSGSTGFSKGVMLSERSLWSNAQYCIDGLKFLLPGDRMLSILPLAHMFGFMVEMVHPFVKGCHTTFLARTPAPKIILAALAEVQPKLIVAVPLIIEKVVRGRVFPALQKPATKFMLAMPGLRNMVHSKVRSQLIKAFGGNLLEMILGGAALDKEVELFLTRIKFPFTVGFGMTECGPLVSYTPWNKRTLGSCGRIVDRMEARIDSADPVNTPGIMWVRGDNVMLGYYKNPEETAKVFEDGWMNTGDICTIDTEGNVYVRGRDKNLILGPSGQNIYPEEVEAVINKQPLVAESVVIDAGGGKLHALIHPNMEEVRVKGVTPEQLNDTLKADVAAANRELPVYSKIASWELREQEFEKTPKQSIKRFLYTKKQQ